MLVHRWGIPTIVSGWPGCYNVPTPHLYLPDAPNESCDDLRSSQTAHQVPTWYLLWQISHMASGVIPAAQRDPGSRTRSQHLPAGDDAASSTITARRGASGVDILVNCCHATG